MRKIAWRIFVQAIFLIRENILQSFFTKLNFRHHFTRYHWLRKFPIVFQPIIIQNYIFAVLLYLNYTALSQ